MLINILWLPNLNAEPQAPPIKPTMLVIGDSLSSAYNMPSSKGWVALLEQQLTEKNYPYTVINRSYSGDTTAIGRARLPKLLAEYQPELVILALGGNDGLRGLPISQIEANLTEMIEQVQDYAAKLLLVGIYLPPNYGPSYVQQFQALYPKLSEAYDVPLIPFLLEGVALDTTLMMKDGIHPKEIAQPIILQTVWPYLCPLLEK
jgi:acyl-CoA thioesterase-1